MAFDKVDGAGLHRLDRGVDRALTTNHDDGHPGRVTRRLCKTSSPDAGHPEVEQGRVERLVLHEPKGLAAVRCADDVLAVVSEQARELAPKHRIVIGDQDLHRRPLEGAGR